MNELESKERLLEALEALDAKLNESGIEFLEIKIVGGFALILHDIRDNGFTQDIDSMTKEFDSNIKEAIAQVGKELGLKLGWLNADMVLDDPEIIEMIVGETNFSEYRNYSVIKAMVADLPTLLRLKVVAAGDNLLIQDDVETERHAKDMLGIMKALKINSEAALLDVAPVAADYPELLKLLF